MMRLTFLGTRGNTEVRTRRHRMHSALLVAGERGPVMIDCGADWRSRIAKLAPKAIVITHAHPDHAWGLLDGAPSPVHATGEAWQGMADFPISEKRTVEPFEPFTVEGLAFEAFPVVHSVRAPAVGYRVGAGGASFFYVPDVVAIPDRSRALGGVTLFIGDGATITRSMVRRRGSALFGHTPIRTQLGWCEKEGVPRAVFTHCGTEILAGDERRLGAKVRAMARAHGVAARIAFDGLEMVLS